MSEREVPKGHVEIAHDGFVGDIIGHYTTREGKHGVVVQQDGTRVVHVYGEKWLKPAAHPVAPSEEVTDAEVEAAARAIAENHWSVDSDFIKAVHVARTWQHHADDARAALQTRNKP